MTVRSIALFVLAAVLEIGGAWLVWQGLREHRGWAWVGVGVVALGLYGVVATFQPDAPFGRVLAAYGGVFIVGSLLWAAVADGSRPDRWDVAGALVCLVGVALVMYAPRARDRLQVAQQRGELGGGQPRGVTAGRHPQHLGVPYDRIGEQRGPVDRLGQPGQPDGDQGAALVLGRDGGQLPEGVHARPGAAADPQQARLARRHQLQPVGAAQAAVQLPQLAGRPAGGDGVRGQAGLDHPAGDLPGLQSRHHPTQPARAAAHRGRLLGVDDEWPGHRVGEPAFRRAAVGVFLAGIAVFATLYAPQALLPELTRSFGVSPAASTLAISISTGSLAVGLLVLGPLSDRRGRTGILHASLAAAAVLAVLIALAPAWWVLLVLRGLQGFALAGLPAVAVAYLREELHPAVSSRAIGLYVSGTAIGGLSGRLLSGFLTELGGWRTALGGAAALAVGCAVAVRVLLPPSRRFAPVRRDGSLVGQLARAFTDPALLALYGVAALLMGGFVAVYNAGTFRLEAAPYALSPAVAALVFLAYLLGSVSSPTAGVLADRFGRRLVVPGAVVVMAAGIALTLPTPLWCVVLGLCVLTSGFFAAHGVASGWVAARAQLGGRAVGQAASLYSFWYYVGSSVGGTLAGRAWQGAGWSGVALLAGGSTLAALLLTVLLGRTRSLERR